MKSALIAAAVLGLTAWPAAPALAQPAKAVAAPAPDQRITVEYYYRIKWGSAGEFKRLYDKNHAPLLAEMQKQGFITAMAVDEPFTHMAGGPRWDLRVTITFRDPAAAILTGGDYDKAWDIAKAKMFPDAKALAAEEAARFALLEEHWDVIVVRY